MANKGEAACFGLAWLPVVCENQSLFQHVTNIRKPEKKGLLTKMKKGTFYIGLFNYCHLVIYALLIIAKTSVMIVTKHSLFERTQLFKSHETTQPIMISFFFSFLFCTLSEKDSLS